jgi:hypothetical protein
MKMRTMYDIRKANEQAGNYFFTPDAMRFFRSRVHDDVYGAGFFVTSEQFDYGYPRYYTVRFARPDGSITTVSTFQQYASRSGAHAAAARYAALHAEGGTVLDDVGQPLNRAVAA